MLSGLLKTIQLIYSKVKSTVIYLIFLPNIYMITPLMACCIWETISECALNVIPRHVVSVFGGK